jgi:hypothetical protein
MKNQTKEILPHYLLKINKDFIQIIYSLWLSIMVDQKLFVISHSNKNLN